MRRVRDLAVRQSLRAKQQQEPVPFGQPAESLARTLQTAILVGQAYGLHTRFVRGQPRNPSPPGPLSIARSMRRHGKQPAADVPAVTAGLQVAEQLQEGLLDDVFGVLMVPDEDGGEAVD